MVRRSKTGGLAYKSKGTLRYSPPLLGEAKENWWAVVNTDPEIGKYYRKIFEIHNFSCRTLNQSTWGDHISVVRNEKPEFQDFWGKHKDIEIEFYYTPIIRNRKKNRHPDVPYYFWLDVISVDLMQIRDELGLPSLPTPEFHLTIGYELPSNDLVF